MNCSFCITTGTESRYSFKEKQARKIATEKTVFPAGFLLATELSEREIKVAGPAVVCSSVAIRISQMCYKIFL